MKYNKSEFELKKCDGSNLDEILKLQEDTFAILPDITLLRYNPPEVLAKCLEDPNCTLGVFHNNTLVAIGVLFDGLMTDDNLGNDIGIKGEELLQVANAKLFIVAQDYRGNGLQKYLIEKVEEIAKAKNKKILCSNVSPDNIYSIRNFEKCGFVFHSEKIKFGGMRRNIYYKKINPSV